jgi:hypothetical protein
MYAQRDNEIMDEETWSEHIRMYFHQPGAQAYWSLRRKTFVPRFRDYLESPAPPDMKSFVDIVSDPV